MWQEIVHVLSGPGRVDARFPGFTIPTDHPPEGDREGRAPDPWCLFLASIGTCMASFVAAECARLGLPDDGIRLVQRQEIAEDDDVVREVRVEIRLPEGFPAGHGAALVEAARRCTVKRTIEAAPRILVAAKDGYTVP